MILFADKMKRILFLLALSCACLFVTGHSACLYAQQTATREAAVNHWQLGMKAHSESDLQQAERFVLTAASAFRELGDQQAEADMLTWLAVLKLDSGDVAIANRVLVRARETYGSLMTRPGKFAAMPSIEQMDRISTAMSMHFEAGKYLNKGDFNNTVKLLEKILEAVIELNAKKYIGRLQFQVGRIYAAHLVDLTKALDFYDKAGKTYELLGDAQKISEIEAFINLAKAGLILSAVDRDVKDAEIHIKTALKTAERLSDSILLRESYYLLALMHFRIRDFNSYLAYADKRIAANRNPGNELDLFTVLLETSYAYEKIGRFSKAIEICNEAIDLAKQLNDEPKYRLAKGRLYLLKGSALIARNDKSVLNEAADNFLKALEIGEEYLDYEARRETYKLLAMLYFVTRDDEKAIEYHKKTLELSADDRQSQLDVLLPLVRLLIDRGEYDNALSYAHKSYELAETLRDVTRQMKSVLQLANIHNLMGRYTDAINYATKAVDLGQKNKDYEIEVDGNIEIGNIWDSLHNPMKSIEHYSNAFRILNKIANPERKDIRESILLIKFYSICKSYPITEMSDYMMKYLATSCVNIQLMAVEKYKERGNRRLEGEIYLRLAMYYCSLNDKEPANKYLKMAKDAILNQADKSNLHYIFSTMADINVCLGNSFEALNDYREGFRIIEESDNKSTLWRPTLAYKMSFGLTSLKLYEEAKKAAMNALVLIHEDDRVMKCKIHELLGLIHWRLNELELSQIHLMASLKLYEEIRAHISSLEERGSYSSSIKYDTSYSLLIDVLIKLGKYVEAFDMLERAKSRTFLDSLGSKLKFERITNRDLKEKEKILRMKKDSLSWQIVKIQSNDQPVRKEVRDALFRNLESVIREYADVVSMIKKDDPEIGSLISVAPLKMVEARALLDSETTLLGYSFGAEPDRVLIWVIDESGYNFMEVPIRNVESIIDKIIQFRNAISNLTEYKDLAHELYELLIRPVVPFIKTKRIVIIPRSALYYLPFQALLVNSNDEDEKPKAIRDKFLIEQYEILYVPSASVLKFVLEKRKPFTGRILAFGNPVLEEESLNLPHAETEVQRLDTIFPQTSSLFLRERATEKRAKELTTGYNAIHFATHGELKTDAPLLSSIRLAKDKEEDGRLEVQEIFNLDLQNASLVTLSACETALGRMMAGDELIGLTRGFIYAGAPSIVASLWKVNDESTAKFMELFYRNLKTYPKAQALRLAQIEMIRGKTGRGIVRGVGGITEGKKQKFVPVEKGIQTVDGSHPYFWAPFILIGDWQ